MTKRISAVLAMLFLLFCGMISAEEDAQYTIEYRIEPSAIYEFDLTESTKTVISDPATNGTIILGLSSHLGNSYVTLVQNGIWIRYISQRAFRDLVVDEATTNGAELPHAEIERQKEMELKTQRLDNSIFDFGVISETGAPDPSSSGNDLQAVLNFSAGNIVNLPAQKRSVGEEWTFQLKIGDYKTVISYTFDSIETIDGNQCANIKGGIRFVDIGPTDPLAIMRVFVFELKLDLVKKTAVETKVHTVFGIKKDEQLVTRQISVNKTLKSMRKLTKEELEKASGESEMLKNAIALERAGKYESMPAELETILAKGGSLFNEGIMLFLRDHVFLNREPFEKKLNRFWFTDWTNTAPLSLEALKGRYVLMSFFDPDVASSTRIWRPWEDWTTNFGPKGLTLIAASSAKKERVQAYVKEMGITYPIAYDENYMMLNYFKISVLPSFVLLDGEGRMIFSLSGKNELFRLHSKLEELFGKIE